MEVGNIDEALIFYGNFIEFEIESQNKDAALIFFGDQFIDFSLCRNQITDDSRHLGIVVDNKELVRQTLLKMSINFTKTDSLFFHDPWGNYIEIMAYDKTLYTKADDILKKMGLGHLTKTDEALAELRKKNMAY